MQQDVLLRRLLLGCWLGLLLTLSAPLVLSGRASIGLWLMQCVPLLLTLPGLRKLAARPLQWLGFLVLFYFVQGVLQVSGTTPEYRWMGALTLVLCLALFTAVIVAVRRGKRLHQE